jgi:hypothetical protein
MDSSVMVSRGIYNPERELQRVSSLTEMPCSGLDFLLKLCKYVRISV